MTISPIVGGVEDTKFYTSKSKESRLTDNFTHTVFCEEMLSTSCKHCPTASKALYEIYDSNDYPFYYVTFVYNYSKRTWYAPHAESRAMEDYNLLGFPDAFFDGGYQVVYGGLSETMYRTAIEKCGQREVPNLIMSMDVKWLEDAHLLINLSICNNESQPYRGHLRAYIVEPVSRWTLLQKINSVPRWNLNDKETIHFGFLGYVFDENISMNEEENLHFCADWDGDRQGYGDILFENVMVVAAVFNATSEIQYSNPPDNTREFFAYYVDQATAAIPVIDDTYVQKDISRNESRKTLVKNYEAVFDEARLNVSYNNGSIHNLARLVLWILEFLRGYT